jgi:serine/threonine protein phosphatase PrpC
MNEIQNTHTNNEQIEVGMICHKGLVRAKHQDHVLVLKDKGIFLLADGMGGHAGGEIASRIAVEVAAKEIQAGSDLTSAILKANQEIKNVVERNEGAKDMGTTIVALLLTCNTYQLAWVGDSRAYKINGGIEQITTDHSLVQELVDQGIISQEKAETHPKRNILTRALGIMDNSIEMVGKLTGKLEENETLLICSDGLHGLVSDKRIRRVVAKAKNPQAAVGRLVKLALRAGGTDNISVIAISNNLSSHQKSKNKILRLLTQFRR